MQPLILLVVAFALYSLGAKTAAYLFGRMTLSWATSATFATISILVSGIVAATPLSRLLPVGPTSVGTLLILPATIGAGSWYLHNRMRLQGGEPAGWGKCVAVAAIPFVVIAVVGVVAAVLLASRSR